MAPHGPKRLNYPFVFVVVCLALCLGPKTATLQTNTPRRITLTPEHATSLNPTISGDGRRVVFETTVDLAGRDSTPQFRAYAADASTDPPAFAPVAAARALAAAVSQDGSRVAFSSAEDLTGANADRNPEIFLSDRGTLRQLTNSAPADASARLRDGNFQPSISDDGRLVAFASNRDLAGTNPDGNDEIFLLDSHTNTFKQLTDTLAPARNAQAKLSGDGSRVAFVRESPAPAQPADSEPRRDLVIHERATDTARTAAENVAHLALTPGRAISDDGLRVVFSAADSRGASQVFLFDGRNDSVLRQLTHLGTRQTDVPLHPSISGDGSRVVFATRRSVAGGNSDSSVELYLHDIPTNSTSRLTDAPREATAEVVSSLDDEGASVAFNFPRPLAGPLVSAEFADTSEIFLARPPARAPFSSDLQLVHAATHGREPSSEKVFAPGQIAHATGANLSLVSRQSARLPGGDFPKNLSGVTVTVNRRPARLYYVSPAQVNFQIPAETETGAAEVAVRNHDGYESRAVVQIATSAPGIFTERGDGTGAAAALDALTQLRAPFDPVDAANNPRTLVIFATGVARARTLAVSLEGRDAPVEAVIHSAELPGLDEIHVRLRHSLAGAGAVRCVLAADGRESNAATIQFTGTRRPARITLAPGAAALGVGRALRLVAIVFDAEGGEIAGATVAFTSSDDNVAKVDANGFVRGISAGAATITATVTTAAGELSASSQLTVHPLALVVNEVLADPPDGTAGDANRDGVRSASDDEFVEIVNASASDIDLDGYRIETRNTSGADVVRHTFAPGSILAPGTAAVIFGGAESAAFNPHGAAFGGALVLTASAGALSLPNGGGAVTLRSPAGDVVEQLIYGDSPHDADRNQSLTRAPDVTGDFTLHLNSTPQPTRAFSPGTKIDGTPFDTTAPIERVEVEPSEATVQTGERRQFSARAFDERGSELSGVIFRWESRDASLAVVDQNGLATARAAGSTEIVARARGVASRPATLTVIPPPPRVVRVELSPAEGAINRGGTQSFSARAFDREGRVVADAVFSWTSSDAGVAAVNNEGLARGIGAGTISITATTPDGAGGNVSATARLEVRVPVVLNELLADVPPDDAATVAIEGDANRDGLRGSGDDEFVELLNASDAPVDLSGLRLSDATATRFTFPAGTSLAAGGAVVVFGGGSPPPNDPAFGGALILKANALSLNDGGDTVSLKLTVGSSEFVVLTQTYGTAGGPPAPSDQSLTRAPDGSAASTGDPFVPHANATNAAARAFSPGTRADGTPFGSPPVTRIEISPASATLDLGATQTFSARAFASPDGAEIEIANTSFVWDASDASKASLAPTTGAHTNADADAAGVLTVRARAGGREATATLTVKPPPPSLTRVELTPQSAILSAGESRQFTARAFDQYGAPFPVGSLAFTSSDPAVASVISQSFTPGGTDATATVNAHGEGAAQLTATATDGGRSVASAPALVTVEPPPAVPAAGQVVINEALVSFAASSTQQRADFVELHNTTDRTLDISGLVVSFRPGGNTSTVRRITLPGAVGSDTLRLPPRGYFLIVNGTQTFGVSIASDGGRPDGFDASKAATDIVAGTPAPSGCAATSSCFDLNGSGGGIKIEIGGAKLDGLSYQSGGSIAPFDTFGEGSIFTFTSGATNDLIRSPNAADTDNNSADFRRNGTAASVTPKAANP